MRVDVVVVGAGHAGCEAAFAAARLGCRVALCTMSGDTVAAMPCNPAVGGTAKGHLVREIDALGGLMGQAIDETGIQFKLLNRSRGPAVWSPRAQADKRVYSEWMRARLESEPNIDWVFGRVGKLTHRTAGIGGSGAGRREEHREPDSGYNHWDVPQWPHSRRAGPTTRRPARRTCLALPGRVSEEPRPSMGTAEDRNASAPRSRHDRFFAASRRAGRRRSGSLSRS